MSEESGDY
jgi:hypothetical protein